MKLWTQIAFLNPQLSPRSYRGIQSEKNQGYFETNEMYFTGATLMHYRYLTILTCLLNLFQYTCCNTGLVPNFQEYWERVIHNVWQSPELNFAKVFIKATSNQLRWRSTSCHKSHMGRAAHHSGGTGCGSSELPTWCRSCRRRDTLPDLLRVKQGHTWVTITQRIKHWTLALWWLLLCYLFSLISEKMPDLGLRQKKKHVKNNK